MMPDTNEADMFLKNCWYVAGWGSDIDSEPLARTLLCEPVVLFRTGDGTPVALEDRCCHRALPLSMGKVIGNRLQCGYHGMEYDAAGICVAVPGQDHVPPGARVRAYPVVERWQLIWIWMGDAALADPDLIPDYWWFDHPDWDVVRGKFLHIDCNYQLINENLLDLSHLSYVHLQTIGTTAITEFPITTDREENLVRMTRWILDRPPPPMFASVGSLKGTVDRWQIVELTSPCHTLIYAGACEAGTAKPEAGEPKGGMHLRIFNAATPETGNSTFYFFGHARDFALGDDAVSTTMFEMVSQTFDEDVVILEAQQKAQERTPDAPMVDINVDAPGLAARHMVHRDIAAEAARRAG
jgi:phenylpropionate dioxygenase-like ring-hydroxylating dioxygenase large terminal subunit